MSLISGVWGKKEKGDGLSKPDSEGKRSIDAPVTGQSLYIGTPEYEFTTRVKSWLEYLQVLDLFPNLSELPAKIIEVGEKLRDAGDASFLGLSDKKTNSALIRPGDYVILLHELTHTNPEIKNSVLSSEAGAFAIGIFTAGDFEWNIKTLTQEMRYRDEDKRKGRIIAEASLVLGRQIFDYLKNHEKSTSEVTLVAEIGELAERYEREFFESGKSVEDYLIECHGLTPFIADYLLGITQDGEETVIRSTSQTKKEVIGAFKALASFYHINLGYSLEEAIEKTEQHFKEEEALTIHKTLMKGAKDVFAKLKEYGYNLEICRKVSEAMISHGASRSIAYAKGLPKFLELTGQYGPKGKEILGFALAHPNFLNILTLTNGADGLLELSKSEPEQVSMILAELPKYDWSHSLPTSSTTSLHMGRLYREQGLTLLRLSQEEKASAAALAFYLSSMEEEHSKQITTGFKPHNYMPSTLIELGNIISPNTLEGKSVHELAEEIRKKAAELSYTPPKQLTQGGENQPKNNEKIS